MKERIKTPIHYVGEVAKSSLVPLVEIKEGSLQDMSREALNSSPSFRNFKEEKQLKAIQALSVIGAYTLTQCHGRWNRTRWVEQWENIQEIAKPAFSQGARNTSRQAMEMGYQVLFNMFEAKVTNRKELAEIKKALKNVDHTRGRVSHTVQTPTSKPTSYS